jgi:hypothetical protein
MSGHLLAKPKEGQMDITTATNDMLNLEFQGVPIITHLKAFRIHPHYKKVVGP